MSAPSEFRYRDRAHSRRARVVRRVTRAVAGFDPAPSPELLSAFEEAYQRGDPLAETFVREQGRQGLSAARQKLASAQGSPTRDGVSAALGALLDDLNARPAWLDEAKLALGAKTFRRYGSAVFRFAGAITLAGYRESSVAKPLALSGAYVGAGTRARFLETASFWIEVSEPGGLDPSAKGFEMTQHVRLLHAMVRLRVRPHPEWNEAAWGVPINEDDALLTLMGGSVAPGLLMRVLGFRTSRVEIEAMLHFWRYVGHLMGVRFSPYPEHIEDALRISYIAWLKGSGTAGEDGRALCRSYVEAFASAPDDGVFGWLEEGLHRGMTRLFLPTAVYREQGLPPAGLWPLLPLSAFPLVFVAETLRRRVPGLDGIADHIARAERRAWLERNTSGRVAPFAPAEQLTR